MICKLIKICMYNRSYYCTILFNISECTWLEAPVHIPILEAPCVEQRGRVMVLCRRIEGLYCKESTVQHRMNHHL